MGVFTTKHRFQLKNHLLSGICFGELVKVLYRFRKEIDFAYYLHRIVFLLSFSLFNSFVGFVEELIYRRQVEATKLHPKVVFILGHPRTGTTHVHNLLSLDKSFAYANTFECGFPSTFLLLERFSWLLKPMIDKTRPMDGMALRFTLPQEDEVATNQLCGLSPYLQIAVMTKFSTFRPYFEFNEEDCPPDEKRRWQTSFLHFLRKVQYKHGYKPLVIKSPVHTARIPLLLEMFPQAKFVYCHRNPYEVFQSACHMADTYYWFCYLNRVKEEDIMNFIVEQYKLLYSAYTRDRKLLDDSSLFEVPFELLDRDPRRVIRDLYHQLNLPSYDAMRLAMDDYLSTEIKGFKKNAHKSLSRDMKDLVRREWKESFGTFGYSL